MTDDDEADPIGEIRKVRSIFWNGDWVLHRCVNDPEGRRGLVVAVLFHGCGVRYTVQWSISESQLHDEIELEPAGVAS